MMEKLPRYTSSTDSNYINQEGEKQHEQSEEEDSNNLKAHFYPPQPSSSISSAQPDQNSNSPPSRPMNLLLRRETWASLLTPEKKLADSNPSYKESLYVIICSSWLNLLLIFIPISWTLHFVTPDQDGAIFTTCMLAVIPLEYLLEFGTEEIAMRVGQTLGGLINATLGNAVEFIVAMLALVKCELVVVQTSLLGLILGNLLLVLGACFFAGGIQSSEQAFPMAAAQIDSSFLMISVIAILMPAGFHAASSKLGDSVEGPDVLKMSRGISVILLITYAAYLVFHLWSNAPIYCQPSTPSPQVTQTLATCSGQTVLRESTSAQTQHTILAMQNSQEAGPSKLQEEEVEVPSLNSFSALALLFLSTCIVGVTSEWLVNSIKGITKSGVISEAWIGLILLPIVTNSAGRLTENLSSAISGSGKNKLGLSMTVALGSSIQIMLFVIPLLVVLGWILDKPLTLLFDPLESITLFLSVLIVNYTIQDGRAYWFEGFMLMSVYLIVAVVFFFYPSAGSSVFLGLVCT